MDLLQSNFADQWRPKGLPDKNDLSCSKKTILSCQQRGERDEDKCCTCNAKPIWEGKEQQLNIEYIHILGKTLVLHENPVNVTSVYKIQHSHGEMSQIPINICNPDQSSQKTLDKLSPSEREIANISPLLPRIVKIDLSYNKLSDIGDLNCLTALDTLDLSSNRITYLSNTSFSSLSHLRVLLLNQNRIKMMDTFVLGPETMHLSQVDLSGNQLESLDISNFITENAFCLLDYSGNVIEELTNVQNRKLDTSKQYEGGFVSFQGNMFTTFPDFKELLDLPGIEQLGSVLNFGFDFRAAAIGCDCVLEPLMEKSKDFVKTYWRDYFDVKCSSPERLKGKSVVNVTLDDLHCDLTPKDGCPFQCECKDIPSQRTLYVNCANTGKTEFPAELPFSKYSENINLNLTGNEITKIGNVPYLNKISNLDISHNELVEIDAEIAQKLENASIDLSANKRLSSLPHSMQYRNMCSIHTSSLVLDCTCDSKWMENWMNIKNCPKSENFQCRVEKYGIMPASDFRKEMLDCNPKDRFLTTVATTVASILTTIILSATLIFKFRYEVLIILLKMRQKNPNSVQPQLNYDAFISFDTDNDELQKWVYMTLVPNLEQDGYKIFLPGRDIPFGEVRAAVTIDTLQTTHNFVLILSESYLEQEDQVWTDNEWKYGWHMFKADSQKNIVLINYDHVSSFDVDHPQIKAFLRVGGQVDFLNPHRNIMEKISDKLGPTCAVTKQFYHDCNKKQIFVPVHLFQAENTEQSGVKEAFKANEADYYINVDLRNEEDISDNNDDNTNTLTYKKLNTDNDNKTDNVANEDLKKTEQNCFNRSDVDLAHENGVQKFSGGILDIKEMRRSVKGPLKYWERKEHLTALSDT